MTKRILQKISGVASNIYNHRYCFVTISSGIPSLNIQTILFQNYERMNLADALVPKTYTKGERIIHQGN